MATTVPERVNSVTIIKVNKQPILNLGSSNVRRESGEKCQLRGAMSELFLLRCRGSGIWNNTRQGRV
jgi:hypothetical protein